MSPSQATLDYITKQDAALNKRAGWEQNSLDNLVNRLLTYGLVEVGWRESCGTTDRTHHIYRAWLKVLPKLKKDLPVITEERGKHGNSYATSKGGFWNSIIYTLEKPTAKPTEPEIPWSSIFPDSLEPTGASDFNNKPTREA